MPTFRALLTALAFLAWGLVIGLAFGVQWGTQEAGNIATASSFLALIYGSAAYRSSQKRSHNKKVEK